MTHSRELGFNPGGHGKSDRGRALVREVQGPLGSGRAQDQRGVVEGRAFHCVQVWRVATGLAQAVVVTSEERAGQSRETQGQRGRPGARKGRGSRRNWEETSWNLMWPIRRRCRWENTLKAL